MNLEVLKTMKQVMCLLTVLVLSFPCPTIRAGVNELLPRPKLVSVGKGTAVRPKVEVRYVADIPGVERNQNEAYRIKISRFRVLIEAETEHGVWNAMQTLAQLYDGDRLPLCTITDWPSFRLRGYMIDVGRTYMSLDELKRMVDLLSRFKINVFHWHLTENQAWRLESRAFPQLNEAASMTRQPGLYYTLEEARELDAYCRERHVTLIPEFDMPGHSAAFERALGFGMQSPAGKEALKTLLEEACAVFSGPWFHIGTDEVHFTDPAFVPEMVAHVRSLGKKVISWNPGWNYAPGEIDMTQLWSYRGQVQEGIPAIDCRLHYINHYYPFADLVGLYTSRIGRQDADGSGIAGSILALWTDRPILDERQLLLQNSFYPHALALAARAWQGGGYQYFDDFGVNLPVDSAHPATADFLDFERRMLYHAGHSLPDGTPFPYVRQSDRIWQISEIYDNEGHTERSFAPEEALAAADPASFLSGLATGQARGPAVLFRHYWGKTVAAYCDDPQPNSTVYAWTQVWSDTDRTAGLLFETQDYSRTDRDQAPPQGRWDYPGSRIWLNGAEILPPVWTGPTGPVDWETPFGNENCLGREALPVSLRAGWNWILIKLPVGAFQIPGIRLVKWGFYCALTEE